MIKVIFLNGPPRCGKDSIARFLCREYADIFYTQRMSESLKLGVHSLLGLPRGARNDHAFYEIQKDLRIPEFFDHTPRELYIAAAENFFKKIFSKDVFGYIWLRMNREYEESYPGHCVLIPDVGFQEEVAPIVNYFGSENCMLIRIHRPGQDFSHDSRGYIYDVCDHEFAIVNNTGKINDYFSRVNYALEERGIFADYYGM